MNDIFGSLSPWVPQFSIENKIKIWDLINSMEENSATKYYVSLIKDYINKFDLLNQKTSPPDMLASGFIFFYGCSIFLTHNENWNNKINDVIKYSMLYMIADNYIDSTIFSKNISNQMKIAIFRKEGKITDPLVKYLRELYLDLVSINPNCEKYIINLFNSEIDGLKIQNNSNLSEEEYFKIACEKGGQTFLVLNTFVNQNNIEYNYYSELQKKLTSDVIFDISRSAYYIGALMQLFDDSLDVNDDISNNIHTIATWHYKQYGNLDILWKKIANMVLKIDSPFMSFKLIYSQLCTYIPGRVSFYYSDELLTWTQSRNMFPNTNCSKYIIENILEELQN